ncbi:MAG: alpha-ketoglutarate-dependent dioxygenase AlkB family protein [Actinomycetota bacterium]
MTLFTDDDPRGILPFDGAARYVPAFIPADEADRHFTGIVEETPWEERHIVLFGREVLQPRLACWYGDHAYSYSGIRLEPRAWTDRLRVLRDRCGIDSGVEFNSCLANLYRDGRDSMGWHADDEPELGREPVIASLSLGDTRVFRMRHKETKTVVEIPLEHGSLLVMSGLMQQCWVHEIPKTKKPVGQRINLTFRVIVTDADRQSAHRRAVV